MKRLRTIICPVLLTVFLLLAVRGLLVCHMSMPAGCAVPGFLPGQHVLVSLTYYGLRLPGESLWGYHRWGYRVPEAGEALVFLLPEPKRPAGEGARTAGVCRALPGDTVWIDPERKIYIPGRTSPAAQPVVIPGRRNKVRVTPYNARLLAYLLRQYEHCKATVDSRNRIVLNKEPVASVRFARDYYWVETAPDTYVLVPHDALVGKIVYALKFRK